MNIYEIEFTLKNNEKTIKIFNDNFIKNNKYKFKIVYNNKIYPFQNEFSINGNILGNSKIKLISFIFNSEIKNISKYLALSNLIHENKKYKNNINKYSQYLKCSFYELSKIIYKVDRRKSEIKIFGKTFVMNNKDKCIIVYKDMVLTLREYLTIDNNTRNFDDTIEIFLIELKYIIDKSYMFYFCNLLKEFPLFKENDKSLNLTKSSEDNTYSIKIESSCENNFYSNCKIIYNQTQTRSSSSNYSMLDEFSKILFLPNKSNWNSCICTNMCSMFEGCSSLISLPDLSKWNTINVKDMNNMLLNCCSLTSIPDISNWNIINVIDLSNMFDNCSSLLSLPDISKWNTINVKNMSSVFLGCSSLQYLPNISKWNTTNVSNMKSLFEGCSSLISLPDISKWNTINLQNMNKMFKDCSNLT